MKKLLLIISLAIIGLIKTQAKDADLFTYDKNTIQNSLRELDVLESYVAEHPALAIVTETEIGSVMVNGIKLATNPFGDGAEPPLGIPSFFVGLLFGVAGLIVVYIVTDNNKAETRKALWGCVTTYVVIGIIYIVAIATASTTTNNQYYY